jgi:hypothetical protein
MHETDAPEPTATPDDPELDGFESDLDAVASALDALDADDLDAAEALVAGIDRAAPEVVVGDDDGSADAASDAH